MKYFILHLKCIWNHLFYYQSNSKYLNFLMKLCNTIQLKLSLAIKRHPLVALSYFETRVHTFEYRVSHRNKRRKCSLSGRNGVATSKLASRDTHRCKRYNGPTIGGAPRVESGHLRTPVVSFSRIRGVKGV